ncbi:hypothetical protein [Xylanibacter muris]|uniref:Tetratricopeptide repeat protein n=1 Tax=Xylanibacter muris TaxID=2736290 RepID=A0ABX2ALY3_9BACT|nr:hypothetical protein [Xylanibacter muris]NPD92221.1 hypothetical protein [Xylanibacter muris]
MKKLMMMAAVAAMSASAFAQDAKTEAEKWNQVCKDQYQIYVDNSTIQTTNQTTKATNPFDTVAMYKAGMEALKAAMKCDEFDRQPNEKGKVKIRFRADNQKTASQLRIAAIQGGEFFRTEKKDNAMALEGYKLYIDSKDHELFTGIDMSNDPLYSQIAYMASYMAYMMKDYAAAIDYATKAKETAADDKGKADANEIILFAKKDNCKSAADSAAFMNDLKVLHKENPADERYFNMLLAYYNDHPAEKMAWITEETQANPSNKMAWAIKGETEMKNEQWDDAVASYRKAVEIDPNFVAVIFNIGTSLNSKAIALKDKLADKNTGGLTKANADKVKAVLAEAKEALLKAKELDPSREKVNWAYALYQVYYSLGDKANSDEMEKLLNK